MVRTIFIIMTIFFNGMAFTQVESYYRLGYDEQNNKNYSKAIEYYQLSIKNNQDIFASYSKMGYIRKWKLNDLTQANLDFKMAFTYASHPWERKGIITDIIGFEKPDYKLAIHILDSLILTDESDIYYKDRARYYEKLNNPRMAIADYKMVLKLTHEEDLDTYWNIASLSMDISEFMDATKYWNKIIDACLKEPDKHSESDKLNWLYLSRAKCKMEMGDFGGSLDDLKIALSYGKKVKSNYTKGGPHAIPEIYNYMARVKIGMKDYSGAVEDATNSIESNENNTLHIVDGILEESNSDLSYSYNLRGIAYFNLGKLSQACADWSKSGELGEPAAYDNIRQNCNK